MQDIALITFRNKQKFRPGTNALDDGLVVQKT